jgi:hypothetical protein
MTDLTCGASQPHLLASGLPLRSHVFSCPLEPSRQFSQNSDLIWFGLLTPTPSRLILFLSLKIHNSQKALKIVMLVQQPCTNNAFAIILCIN